MSRNTTAQVATVDYQALLGPEHDGFDQATVEAYKAAPDNKARALVRGTVKANQQQAMKSLDAFAGRYWLNTDEQLRVDSAKAEKADQPVEITLATRVAVLRKAADMIESGTVRPEGLAAFDGDLPEVDWNEELDAAASKLASAKITRSVERHSIGEVIERAFESDDAEGSDTLTIAQVRRFGSVEGYQPSPGAIRAHLEGTNPIEGYELVPAQGDQPYSVRKV